jgi:hypothetical protein
LDRAGSWTELRPGGRSAGRWTHWIPSRKDVESSWTDCGGCGKDGKGFRNTVGEERRALHPRVGRQAARTAPYLILTQSDRIEKHWARNWKG